MSLYMLVHRTSVLNKALCPSPCDLNPPGHFHWTNTFDAKCSQLHFISRILWQIGILSLELWKPYLVRNKGKVLRSYLYFGRWKCDLRKRCLFSYDLETFTLTIKIIKIIKNNKLVCVFLCETVEFLISILSQNHLYNLIVLNYRPH